MNDTLHIHLDRAEGSLQRLIGLIERRGFEIQAMVVGDHDHDIATRTLKVSVRARDAGRCTDILGRQIDRLYGVKRIAGAAAEPFEGRVAVCIP
jgi:acetolactate synthase II small subunit